MKDYFTTVIRITDSSKDSMSESILNLKSYLENEGKAYYQNMDNSKRKEFHYFMGNSVVFIKQLPKVSNIKIITTNENTLSRMKSKIEKILNEDC
jgi:hypothetical protein